MSQKTRKSHPELNSEIPNTDDEDTIVIDFNQKIGESEEVHELPIGTRVKNRTVAFLRKYKTHLVAGGAATAGFLAHAFLARPDDCAVDYDSDSYEYENDDDSAELEDETTEEV